MTTKPNDVGIKPMAENKTKPNDANIHESTASGVNDAQRAGCQLVVDLPCEGAKQKALLAKLGEHKMSKARLYFKQLADLDTSVLVQLIANPVAEVRKWPGEVRNGPHVARLLLR